ncbi:MAG: hypothetical protein EOO84_08565 [Pantoea sp.]|uniref:hypothetical protein n=1 Tax=Pantoea sp. TaxID=69393 RepID=UPI00120BE655|nr:hypothetical protein [Pantoea sp.]RZK07933.1 MAG: hypothetical protein EOO84_08565 [Pantoea sp.]
MILFFITLPVLALNITIMYLTNTDPALLLGWESLALTLLGVSYLSKEYGTYTNKAGKKIDILNVVAVAVAVSAGFGPWAVNFGNNSNDSNIYVFIAAFGLIGLFFDWLLFKNKQTSRKVHQSETIIVETNLETKITTTIKK